MFPMQAKLKSPGGCRAWLEEKPIWEIEEVEDSIKFANKAMCEQGIESPEIIPVLFWDGQEGRGRDLKPDFYKEVLNLAENILSHNNIEAAIEFWEEFGPLVKGRSINIPRLKNILQFFCMVTDLWDACINQRSDIMKEYLSEQKNPLTDIDDFVSGFKKSVPHLFDNKPKTREKRYLYIGNGIPLILKSPASQYGKEFCLVLRYPIPDINSDAIYLYLKEALSKNITRRLSNTRLISLNLDENGSFTELIAPTLFDAALFSFFLSTPQIRPCVCGCGEPARPGSKYADDSHRLKHSRIKNEAGTIKNRCLSFYGKKKRKGMISEEVYEVIKVQVDRLIKDGRELEKSLKRFCIKNQFPVWQPRVQIYRDTWE